METFKLTTEDTCDLPTSFFEAHDVGRAALHYYLDETEQTSLHYDAKAFFTRLRAGGKVTTSQMNAFEFYAFWKPLCMEGRDILHLSFSSALSGTYGNAVQAAELLKKEFPERKLYVCDTCSQSGGQGLLLTLVSRFKENGHTFEECCEYAEKTKGKIAHIFTVNDLRWLVSTGRVKKAEAFIGNMLMIKPVLYTSAEGKLTPYARYISRKPALNALCEKVKKKYSGEEGLIYISHGDCASDARYVADRLAQLGAKTEILDISPIIACHTGPDVLAVFFVSADREMRE